MNNEIAFTFANAEIGKFGQSFIKATELCTGKLKLKKLYEEGYISKSRYNVLIRDLKNQ